MRIFAKFAVVILLLLFYSFGYASINENVLRNDQVKALEKDYNIEIYLDRFKPSSYASRWASWTTLSDEDSTIFYPFIKVFYEEWAKYPLAWIEINNLKGIAFVKDLVVVGQERFAMPDAYGEVLYYDVDYLVYGQRYVRECIHHEFYHMIEENFFSDMYYKDPLWNALNPDGFRYGDGGYAAYSNATYANEKHPMKGFVTGYATYGLEEDKAEVYSYLFSNESYFELLQWIAEDDILYAKVRYMKSFVAAKVPEMDESYFINIHRLK